MGVQVQSATKNGEGISLSVLERQFISFSYGYKKNENGEDIPVRIEDFDLLASFNNDRLNKDLYSQVNNITTTQSELDGQMFWGYNLAAGKLSFTLVTDGMTAAQLEEFKRWFRPGEEKELILSEHHNRAIMARVESAPSMSMLPFEKELMIKVGDTNYPTKTSLYKGDITLDFTMDDPYWYAISSCLASDTEINLATAKVIYEDGLPHVKMFTGSNILLANNKVYEDPILKEEQTNITISYRDEIPSYYLYYCGTAPERPSLSFSIPWSYASSGTPKISFIKDSNSEEINSFLKIGNNNKLTWSLPSIFTSFNTLLDIVNNYKTGYSILDLRAEIRDYIYNYYVRTFAIGLIDYMMTNHEQCDASGKLGSGFINYIRTEMKKLFPTENNNLYCEIDSKTGKVITKIKVRTFVNRNETEGAPKTITENAGNMIKSNYITIDTRCLPNEGEINGNECLVLTTNTELNNFKIDYKYKYL